MKLYDHRGTFDRVREVGHVCAVAYAELVGEVDIVDGVPVARWRERPGL
jgi:hypothetical protein